MASELITGDCHGRRIVHPVTIVLDRLRSAFNTGNIFRLADTCGAREVVTCGYTPTPPHPKLAESARGAERVVPVRYFPDSLTAVRALQAEGVTVVAVETVASAPLLWEARWTWPVAFVFGNEALGVAEDTLAAVDQIVRLPVFGLKNSLNVANCAAVVLYEAVHRLAAQEPPAHVAPVD
jgi:tRNA G18 (ribose-2'-O)-methylase SpoU